MNTKVWWRNLLEKDNWKIMDFRDIGDEGGRWMELILNPVHN
jgi:hypothetical protein